MGLINWTSYEHRTLSFKVVRRCLDNGNLFELVLVKIGRVEYRMNVVNNYSVKNAVIKKDG